MKKEANLFYNAVACYQINNLLELYHEYKKFLPYIFIILIFVLLFGAYFGRGALKNWLNVITEKVLPLKPKIEVSLDLSTWETFQSERLGFSLKYPKEWKKEQRTGYPWFISQDNKCVIVTGVKPTDPGQTVEQWFIEMWDLGGLPGEFLSYEFVTVAKTRGILAKYPEVLIKMGEPGFEKQPQTTNVGMIQLYLPQPKEDYVFILSLSPAYEERTLSGECKTIFNLMTKTLELQERKLENE